MKSLFKNRIKHPDKRKAYAVLTGDYVGEMLVYIQEEGDNFLFLSIPKNTNRLIPKEKFDFAWNHNIIEFVETLPRDVYKVITKQFQYNEDHPSN
jgi:hypothetical protein